MLTVQELEEGFREISPRLWRCYWGPFVIWLREEVRGPYKHTVKINTPSFPVARLQGGCRDRLLKRAVDYINDLPPETFYQVAEFLQEQKPRVVGEPALTRVVEG